MIYIYIFIYIYIYVYIYIQQAVICSTSTMETPEE